MPILVVFLIAGVAELAVLVALGQAIGVLPTIGVLLLAALLGGWLLRREGSRTLRELGAAIRMQRSADREISDGMIIAIGALLILLPGLLSDIAGLLCLLPPTRALLRRRLLRTVAARGHRRSDIVEGEVVSVVDDDEPALPSLRDGWGEYRPRN